MRFHYLAAGTMCALLAMFADAACQPTPVISSRPVNGVGVPTHGIYCMDVNGNAQVCNFGPDPNNTSYNANASPITATIGQTYTASRGVMFICSAAGNVSIQTGGVALVIPMPATSSGPPVILPIAVTAINSAGTTAACSYVFLY